jgi:hypothetical protein
MLLKLTVELKLERQKTMFPSGLKDYKLEMSMTSKLFWIIKLVTQTCWKNLFILS